MSQNYLQPASNKFCEPGLTANSGKVVYSLYRFAEVKSQKSKVKINFFFGSNLDKTRD